MGGPTGKEGLLVSMGLPMGGVRGAREEEEGRRKRRRKASGCCPYTHYTEQTSLCLDHYSGRRPGRREKGKYKRKKLNSCEREGKAALKPRSAGILRRDVGLPTPRPPARTHTRTGGWMDGGMEQGRAVERQERAAPLAGEERRMVRG
ncbi:uncharacterized protein ACIB01_008727 [Guaruba guarouba]